MVVELLYITIQSPSPPTLSNRKKPNCHCEALFAEAISHKPAQIGRPEMRLLRRGEALLAMTLDVFEITSSQKTPFTSLRLCGLMVGFLSFNIPFMTSVNTTLHLSKFVSILSVVSRKVATAPM